MKTDYVLACISERSIPENFKSDLDKLIQDFNLSLSKRDQKKTEFYQSLHLTFDGEHLNLGLFNQNLMNLSGIHRIDMGLIPEKIFETKKKLVIFDMDSTLITAEVIDEMALKFGVGEKVKLITAKAMNGELNFDQSLTERVALLKGFSKNHLQEILQGLRFTPGTPEFLGILKQMGIKTAIASGGFKFFAENIQAKLGMDYAFANELEYEGELLTGRIQGSILNAEAKERIVMELGQKEQLTPEEIVAIGDGANDIPMLLKAGLGIAIHAKEKVQRSAHYRINFGPMTHALGFMNHETL